MSQLLDMAKADVADVTAKYREALKDGQLSVSELFALLVLAVVDAIKLAEAVPGATGPAKKTAALGMLDEITKLALADVHLPSVPDFLTQKVIVPAVAELVRYFADKLVDALVQVLVKDGLLKAA